MSSLEDLCPRTSIVGQHICTALRQRGWHLRRAAVEMRMHEGDLARVIRGVDSISPEIACRIAAALDTDASQWMRYGGWSHVDDIRPSDHE